MRPVAWSAGSAVFKYSEIRTSTPRKKK